MKHLSPSELQHAVVTHVKAAMNREEKLLRWADLLERHQGRIFPLDRIEHLSRKERRLVVRDNSPMTIAFADPVLRSEGLAGETLGDAMEFFSLSDGTAHDLFCDCHYQGTLTAEGLASRLRALTLPSPLERLKGYVRSILRR